MVTNSEPKLVNFKLNFNHMCQGTNIISFRKLSKMNSVRFDLFKKILNLHKEQI